MRNERPVTTGVHMAEAAIEGDSILSSDRLACTEQEIRQVQAFNRTLARLPRFRIRNRLVPRALKGLLRLGQIGGDSRLARQGLAVERRIVGPASAPVPVRIISPAGRPKGLVLDFHGGGWVIGNAQMNDTVNAAMVKACEVTVVSVDYRLAPATPIEGLMEDCLNAARWLLTSDDTAFAGLPVVVIGESAGAHLAVATLLGLKETPALLLRISGTVLYYGVYDLGASASVRAAGPDTLVLDGPGMLEAFRALTPGLNEAQRRRPPLSPLYGDFAAFPPALMFAGELDPLRDDTLGLAERWARSAQVEVHLLPAAPHGFIHFPLMLADKVLARTQQWMTERIGH